MPKAKKRKVESKPKVMKIISVLILISLVLSLILGLLYVVAGLTNNLTILSKIPFVGSSMSLQTNDAEMAQFLPSVLAGTGIFMVVWAIFNLIVLKRFNEGKNWARIFYIVIYLLTVIFVLFTIPATLRGSVGFCIYSLIWFIADVYVLLSLFGRKVKNYCTK